MANETFEIDQLKGYVRDVITTHIEDQLHEFKKNLTVAQSKLAEQAQRLELFEKEAEIYRKCHDCHRVNVEKKDACTQTNLENPQPAGEQISEKDDTTMPKMELTIPVSHEPSTSHFTSQTNPQPSVITWHQPKEIFLPSTSRVSPELITIDED